MYNSQGGHVYLEVFGGAGQNGAALLPDRTLVVFQCPQHSLFVVGVPQQHPEVALGLARQLVVEDQAEGPHVGCHQGAEEAGALLLRLQPSVHVQVAVQLWSEGRKRLLDFFSFILQMLRE